MEVTCPACAARYTADDEKLRGKTARMRCKACNTAWLVTGPATSQAMPSSMPASEDPPTERAAVAKTGNEREKRDLFAVREPDLGVVKQTLLPPPALNSALNGGVGARNESSVLFSLEQLGAAARLKTPPPSPAPRLPDEDGVIDLKALTSTPPALRPAPAAVVAPLFSEPAPMTLEVGDTGQSPRAKKRSKLGIFASLVAAAAMLGGLGYGLSIAFKSEEPIKHSAALVVEPPKTEPKVEPPKDPPPPATTAAADDDDKDSKPTKGKKKKGKKGVAAAGKGKPASKPAAPKAADPCGCKGDFNCILACTAKGGK